MGVRTAERITGVSIVPPPTPHYPATPLRLFRGTNEASDAAPCEEAQRGGVVSHACKDRSAAPSRTETSPRRLRFVGGRTVEARYRDVEHAQIDGELRAMMNH